MSGVRIIMVLIATALIGIIAWFLTPKGPQQTLLRTSTLLTLTCCYLMWAITYLAQLHPLIVPIRNDVRLHES